MYRSCKPPQFQCQHSEADTLIIRHLSQVSDLSIVRTNDSDVVCLLLSLAAELCEDEIVCEYDPVNKTRIINVSKLSSHMEREYTGLARAIVPFHALTGCDYTSSFYGKGKIKPFEIMKDNHHHIAALRSLQTPYIDVRRISAFICECYGENKTKDIDEVRYRLFDNMTRSSKKKKIDKFKYGEMLLI